MVRFSAIQIFYIGWLLYIDRFCRQPSGALLIVFRVRGFNVQGRDILCISGSWHPLCNRLYRPSSRITTNVVCLPTLRLLLPIDHISSQLWLSLLLDMITVRKTCHSGVFHDELASTSPVLTLPNEVWLISTFMIHHHFIDQWSLQIEYIWVRGRHLFWADHMFWCTPAGQTLDASVHIIRSGVYHINPRGAVHGTDCYQLVGSLFWTVFCYVCLHLLTPANRSLITLLDSSPSVGLKL